LSHLSCLKNISKFSNDIFYETNYLLISIFDSGSISREYINYIWLHGTKYFLNSYYFLRCFRKSLSFMEPDGSHSIRKSPKFFHTLKQISIPRNQNVSRYTLMSSSHLIRSLESGLFFRVSPPIFSKHLSFPLYLSLDQAISSSLILSPQKKNLWLIQVM
jgi:hypothetical protein